MKKLIIYIAAIIALSFNLYSQGPLGVRDTLAFLKIVNPFLLNDKTLEFDLMISRNSDEWYKLANGTYQFEFENNNEIINSENITIELIQSELNQQLIPGDILPKTGYYIENQIYDGRMSITVMGPPTYELCKLVPQDTFLLIGRFRVQTTNGEKIPTAIRWKAPYNYYQACAFKLAQDSLIHDFVVWYETEDNVEMDDKISNTVSYEGQAAEQYRFTLKYFDAEYAGRKYVDLRLGTFEELNNLGFTILRAPFPDQNMNPLDLSYQDTVFSYLQGNYYNPDLIGKGNTQVGFEYEESQDLVPYRGGTYCYALYASFELQDGSVKDSLVAIDCDDVPHAVIAKASPLQNPFPVKTTLVYELQDDVVLTVKAYDVVGRLIKNLNDDDTGTPLQSVEMKKGIHYTTFYAPELASQGLYDIIFIAEPIEDSAFESSTAVVKVQLLKDGTR